MTIWKLSALVLWVLLCSWEPLSFFIFGNLVLFIECCPPCHCYVSAPTFLTCALPPHEFIRMTYFQITVQVLLFCVFAIGGGYRFFQPIDSLARRMLWVKYFKPGFVRSIAIVEVICGIGLLLPLIFSDFSTGLLFYSGCLLIFTMIGAVVTHAIIGDYRQIFGNCCLIAMLCFITFPIIQ